MIDTSLGGNEKPKIRSALYTKAVFSVFIPRKIIEMLQVSRSAKKTSMMAIYLAAIATINGTSARVYT